MEHSIKRPIEHSIEHPIEHFIERPIERSIERPIEHSIAGPERAQADFFYRLYLGIADGVSIARVWACRYLKADIERVLVPGGRP